MSNSQILITASPKERVFSAADKIADLTKSKPGLKLVHSEVGPSLTKSLVERYLQQWEKFHPEVHDADELSDECMNAMKAEIERCILKAAKNLRSELDRTKEARDALLQENLELAEQIKSMAYEIEILKGQVAEQRGQNLQLQEDLTILRDEVRATTEEAKFELAAASRSIDAVVEKANRTIEQHRERADKAIEENRQATSQALETLALAEAKLAVVPELKALTDTVAQLLMALAQAQEREKWFAEKYENLKNEK